MTDDPTALLMATILAEYLDLYDIEVIPPHESEAGKGFIGTNNDELWQALTERAARAGMTPEQLVHTTIQAAYADFQEYRLRPDDQEP
jgi:hypothetical protein